MIDLKSWCESRHWEELLGCYMEADNPLPPECIGFSSGKLVEWKCRVCGQKWYATPNKMNRKRQDRTVCPFCSHERPSAFYNAAVLYPELIHYWDVEKNQGRSQSCPSCASVLQEITGPTNQFKNAQKARNHAVFRAFSFPKSLLSFVRFWKDLTLPDPVFLD